MPELCPPALCAATTHLSLKSGPRKPRATHNLAQKRNSADEGPGPLELQYNTEVHLDVVQAFTTVRSLNEPYFYPTPMWLSAVPTGRDEISLILEIPNFLLVLGWNRKILLCLALELTTEVLLFPAPGETLPRVVCSVSRPNAIF